MDDLPLHAAFTSTIPGSVPLAAAEVHVWAVPLNGDPERFAELLSASERDRLGRYRFADHQRRYQIGHGALREILAGYLDVAASDVEFRTGPRGKPYLVNGALQFNLSHSGKLALIAVAHTELGVDVEKLRHLESLTPIAQRHFSNSEFEKLDELQGDARKLGFYRCWTRKEAYIKAIGEGLSMALDSFDVSLCEEPEFLACHDGREDPADWSMLDVSPGPEFVGAVAMRAKQSVVKTFRFANC
ncbi:MAG: 4'-phosphopantetheinyl transferase [Planctomycetota bacterium]|jgi:4'-phosphopantetheinyl transferase